MDKWIITFDGDLPYRGVACDKAKIALGIIYSKKDEAQRDLAVLSRYSKLNLRIVKHY